MRCVWFVFLLILLVVRLICFLTCWWRVNACISNYYFILLLWFICRFLGRWVVVILAHVHVIPDSLDVSYTVVFTSACLFIYRWNLCKQNSLILALSAGIRHKWDAIPVIISYIIDFIQLCHVIRVITYNYEHHLFDFFPQKTLIFKETANVNSIILLLWLVRVLNFFFLQTMTFFIFF